MDVQQLSKCCSTACTMSATLAIAPIPARREEMEEDSMRNPGERREGRGR